jgi:anaerobic ribonucleoside-triphosphate reductase activating protein
MFDARAGAAWSMEDLEARLGAAAARGVEGISLLGGEPFEQPAGAAAIARAAKVHGLTVMVFSGYTLPELMLRSDAGPLLALADLLVDGRYDRGRPEPPPPVGRRWIGSTNQVMHYLTSAYSPGEPRMRAPNTVELHWRNGRLLVNGWPEGADALAQALRRGRRAIPS